MTPTVRMFASEEAAQRAASNLKANGFSDVLTLLPPAVGAPADAAVQGGVDQGQIPRNAIAVCVDALQRGRSLVAVAAPFGQALDAIGIMADAGAIETDAIPEPVYRNPSPLSDLLMWPTLAKFEPMSDLLSSSWTFSSRFGMPLLSKNQRGANSSFGIKTLSAPKRKTSSFGIPLLSKNQRGANSFFGIKTLSAPKRKNSSFGFPLLSKNPAPFSSLLGMSTLTEKQ